MDSSVLLVQHTHTNSRVRRQAVYFQHNIVTLSRNRCWCGNTTMHFGRAAELHVTEDCMKILSVAQECFYYIFMSQSDIKTWFFMWSARCSQICDVLLTVHPSVFISVISQLDAQNFCFIISLFHASTCFEHLAHHQEVKIALHSLWYHHHTYRWWWYQRLCNAILTSWWWAHLLETCRGMK